MLAVSPLRNGISDGESEMESFSFEGNDFPDFTNGNLLDSIDFDDLFDGDLLPDLEMDPETLAEFSVINASLESEINNVTSSASTERSEDSSVSRPWSLIQGQDITSKREERVSVNQCTKEADKGRKSSGRSKNLMGKRKMKVDWTPELHRRFVQAVEQLGVDKAVPSRILELMGIDCLTRHNIASHLQKYRSHRKHLLAREAEAASWNQKRQIPGGGGMVPVKRDLNPTWTNAPTTMGFPPVAPAPMPPHYNRPGPMHVWGHPSVDQSLPHTWPKHLTPSPHPWPPYHAQPPHANPPYWHSHHNVPIPTPGTPCYPPHLQPMRFTPPPPVSGIPPPAMYKVAVAPPQAQKLPQPPGHLHPSKECVNAAVEDVLSKPWLPLPLGLKPPSMDSVMVELQTQGMSKIPTTCA